MVLIQPNPRSLIACYRVHFPTWKGAKYQDPKIISYLFIDNAYGVNILIGLLLQQQEFFTQMHVLYFTTFMLNFSPHCSIYEWNKCIEKSGEDFRTLLVAMRAFIDDFFFWKCRHANCVINKWTCIETKT